MVARAIVAVGVILAGCTNQPAAGEIASTAPSFVAPTGPTARPGSPVPSQMPAPISSPSIEPQASSIDAPVPEPPAASLAVEGGDPVVGELGSFAWNNSGSDVPWVPGNPIHIGRGEQLTLSLASSIRLERWTVDRTPGATIGSGVVGMAEGAGEPVAFAAPPRGRWSVSVSVWFADNVGSASYYWLITVD